MKTIISTQDKTLEIDNEEFSNDNYIALTIGKETMDITIDSLLSALESYVEYRKLNYERDLRYSTNE